MYILYIYSAVSSQGEPGRAAATEMAPLELAPLESAPLLSSASGPTGRGDEEVRDCVCVCV